MTRAWYLRDEDAESANQVRERLLEEGICVPAHWALEVCNALLVATRPGRITIEEMSELLPDLRLFPETVDHQTDAAAWSATQDLAKPNGLTLYDAAYIGLALRRGLPRGTLDEGFVASPSCLRPKRDHKTLSDDNGSRQGGRWLGKFPHCAICSQNAHVAIRMVRPTTTGAWWRTAGSALAAWRNADITSWQG